MKKLMTIAAAGILFTGIGAAQLNAAEATPAETAPAVKSAIPAVKKNALRRKGTMKEVLCADCFKKWVEHMAARRAEMRERRPGMRENHPNMRERRPGIQGKRPGMRGKRRGDGPWKDGVKNGMNEEIKHGEKNVDKE